MARLGTFALVLALAAGARADDDAAMGRRVQALLRAHQADVFACVAKQAAPVAGEALLRLFVGPPGELPRVEVLKVEEGKAGARAAADCVAAAARRWDLGPLGASPGDQIVFPLAFRPQGPDTAAVGAHVQLLALPAHMTRSIAVEHATAFYVVGPGAPAIACGDDKATPAVGDVVYARGCTATLSSQAAGAVLQIEATGDAPAPHRFWKSDPDHQHAWPLFDGGASVRLLLDGVDAPFAVDLLCAKKGVEVPQHEHAGSDEIVYVLSGQATTRFRAQQYTEKPGDVVSIPRGTPHALKVDRDLCAVQIYAPGGPEQRFKRAPSEARTTP